MSLVDDIYNASSKSTKTSLLNILVDKAVENSMSVRPDEFSVYQLHLRGDEIYRGHDVIEETSANVYRLTEYDEYIPPHTTVLFWQKLKLRIPHLDTSIIQLSNNLFWDKEKGEILNYEQISDRYKNLQSKNDEIASEDV